ncbi:GIY-YIG nuclease family protein [Actinomadura gamaensis]|uniref:GIY-YIG nuclease family protein n=1 Tax=Actinomadura gamaensis TaxID=1763541 RepID=A0ABV9U0J4_9ACTN
MDVEEVLLTWIWRTVGPVEHREDDPKPRFPELPEAGGVYRIRTLGGNRSYIGQTANLRRRFSQYRNPQASQTHTNRRVHDAVMELVRSRETVIVEVVDEAYVQLSTGPREREAVRMDLKWQRVMIEQAAESSARVNHHEALINKP